MKRICSPPLGDVVSLDDGDDVLLPVELDLEELGDVHEDGERHDGDEVLHEAPLQLAAVVHRLLVARSMPLSNNYLFCRIPHGRGKALAKSIFYVPPAGC